MNGQRYQHISKESRLLLEHMLKMRYSKAKIAVILGVHRSSIYREIKRNSIVAKQISNPSEHYISLLAQKRCLARRRRQTKLSQNTDLKSYIHDKLQKGWSPWQIEGRLKREQIKGYSVSHETIYRYIYSEHGIRNRYYSKLRRKHFFRVKRNSKNTRIPQALMISNRPKEIASREEFGHWEGDLMLFKRGIKGNLITLRERKSRLVIAIKNASKYAKTTALNIITNLKSLKGHIKSITFDQGTEFMRYDWIKGCLEANVYFCEPGSPEQKGSVENGNGVIRVSLSRDFDIAKLKQKELNRLIDEINERPLKCLDYRTPKELFLEETGISL